LPGVRWLSRLIRLGNSQCFRHHFWARLAANIGIVLVFAAFYLRFIRHP
jgi:hypothetical protein